MQQKILFIIEQNVIDGKSYFGSSNDLLLITEALLQNKEVLVITPAEFSTSQNAGTQTEIIAGKLQPIDSKKIAIIYKEALHREAINAITALPARPQDLLKNQILFENIKNVKIDLTKIPVFNRTEPVSLDDKFYDLLIGLKKSGVFITPDPKLTKKLGDKSSIYSIHHNQAIAGVNLADGFSKEELEAGKNKISFDTAIIKISTGKLSAPQILEFYQRLSGFLNSGPSIGNIEDLPIFNKSAAEKKLFSQELKKFYQGAKKYVEFHHKLNAKPYNLQLTTYNLQLNGSIAKPANYFGGCGIVAVKESSIDILQAMKNICKIFNDIKEDCQKNNYQTRAFLPSIIVQEKASEAHLGDLRIVIAGGKLQGIFVRVNPDFKQSNASNMHHGGHPETLFGKYSLNQSGVDQMIADMKNEGLQDNSEEIKKAGALYGLLETIGIITKIDLLKQYPIIGADALLNKQSDGTYNYGINELNLTSPMGQVQLLALGLACEADEMAKNILLNNGFLKKENVKSYQTLSAWFKTQSDIRAKEVRDFLLQNLQLKTLIEKNIIRLLAENNPANKTLEIIFEQFTND